MTKKPGSRAAARDGRGGNPSAHAARGAPIPALQLSPEVARWFAAGGAQFPPSRSATIPMLQSAQAALGYLPADAMRAIARHLGLAPAAVEGVASFYAQFRFDKPGRHRVTVCTGTACYVRGSGKLMEDLQADLHIAPGATSADGAVTLESVSCFGACALAPVVVLDDKVMRQQTSESIKALMRELADEPVAAKRGVAPRQRPPKQGTGPKPKRTSRSPGART